MVIGTTVPEIWEAAGHVGIHVGRKQRFSLSAHQA